MKVAGIERCKKSLLAVVQARTVVVDVRAFEGQDVAPEVLRVVKSIGVDIPIGPAFTDPHPADLLARRRLGGRGVTVFEARHRRVFEAPDCGTTGRLAKPGKERTLQPSGITERMLQVDFRARLSCRFLEVQSDQSFGEMTGRALPSKRPWCALWSRLDQLAKEGIKTPRDYGSCAGEGSPDDLLDAAAAVGHALR